MNRLLQMPLVMMLMASPLLQEMPSCNSNIDYDGDGYTSDVDCDDQDPSIHPDASELPYDGIDQDCSGADLIDVDEDGSAGGPDGTDCDDQDPSTYPGAPELPYDGIDQDCSGADLNDLDEDGSAGGPEGTDCDDQDPSTHPGAPESPNDGIDQDCSGADLIDVDEDGYGSEVDCNDSNAQIHPNSQDLCDGIDNDCDGALDEDPAALYYTDADGDGYGDAQSTPVQSCTTIEGAVTNTYDCDDADASAYPGAPDAVGDGIDQSCDGTDGLAPSVGLPTSTFSTLRAALDAAQEGQTVWVGPGTYRESDLQLAQNRLQLQGVAGSAATIIDAEGHGRLLTIAGTAESRREEVKLQGLTLQNGKVYGDPGAGVLIQHADVTLQDVVLQGHVAALVYTTTMYQSPSAPYSSTTTTSEKTEGGAIAAEDATLHLEQVLIDSNHAYTGAGILLRGSELSGSRVTLRQNTCLLSSTGERSVSWTDNDIFTTKSYGIGGALYAEDSTLLLERSAFSANTASQGGGIAALNSALQLKSTSFKQHLLQENIDAYSNNYNDGDYTKVTSGKGGAVALEDSTLVIQDGHWEENRGALGGALWILNSTLEARRGNLLHNGEHAPACSSSNKTEICEPTRGGGIWAQNAQLKLSGLVLSENHAGIGGGIFLQDSNAELEHLTIAGNQATQGGGLALFGSSPQLRQSILAYNVALNFYADSNSHPTLSYVNLYQAYGASHNLGSLPETVTELEPGFVAFSPDGDPSNDDLHLTPDSALIDAGDPSACSSTDRSGCDPDGSVPDLGAFGGAEADFSYYQDSEQDQLYDGWELAQVGNLSELAGPQDSDADGLTDAQELLQGTSPTTADSDGDGASDGAEVAQSRAPLNPSSVPGVDGLVPLMVPSSRYPSIQIALNAIPVGQEGSVKVAAGTFAENLKLGQKVVTVEGAGEGQTLLDGQAGGSVWTVAQAELHLSHVTVQNGYALSGGGMYFYAAGGSLTHVTLKANKVSSNGSKGNGGGGMYLYDASPSLEHVKFLNNGAYSGYEGQVFGYGGGMYLDHASPTLRAVTFQENYASHSNMANFGLSLGGGMYLNASNPTLQHVVFTRNWVSGYTESDRSYSGGGGGGMYLLSSSPILEHVLFTNNVSSGVYGEGGGMSLTASSPILRYSRFMGNTASYYGGGMSLYESSPTLTHVTFTGNTAMGYYGFGGGMYLEDSSPTLKSCILAYNQASYSGGNLYRYTSEYTPSTILAQNSLIYNPSGWKADNITPSGSYLKVEPKFLDYADRNTGKSCTPGSSTTCVPAELHPALGSPLINAGDPASQDVDGSRADIGSYGGEGGDQWDVDGDGIPDYFWPGERADAPAGFNPAGYDMDDLDPTVR
ncbi:MAG: MopE-related protein [Myxococcota bacterium]